ncbi:hypothetical protein C481_11550 [Natrialba asiatica DSM 12278]|uniref:Uncharacterized protein n=1 Tax=Natrialba asiatica (strain ATCC 700177 / DSM 12278 / JCM 9576 / FERM P-10747 / NBRC 102637 / 172P1) TaxID=29540 RepID=M0ARA9_NATA1|nr:hypothetical protein C481_11550 [Natrialba asiatica DSM 12278]
MYCLLLVSTVNQSVDEFIDGNWCSHVRKEREKVLVGVGNRSRSGIGSVVAVGVGVSVAVGRWTRPRT